MPLSLYSIKTAHSTESVTLSLSLVFSRSSVYQGEEVDAIFNVVNIGDDVATDVSAEIILPSDFKTSKPIESIGVLSPGASEQIIFKLEIGIHTSPGDYIVTVRASYEGQADGPSIKNVIEVIESPFKSIEFNLNPNTVKNDEENDITVSYNIENQSEDDQEDVVVEIEIDRSIFIPVKISESYSTVAPEWHSGKEEFYIRSKKDATPNEYSIKLVVNFRDKYGRQVSILLDEKIVKIEAPSPWWSEIPGFPFEAIAFGIILAIAALILMRRRVVSSR